MVKPMMDKQLDRPMRLNLIKPFLRRASRKMIRLMNILVMKEVRISNKMALMTGWLTINRPMSGLTGGRELIQRSWVSILDGAFRLMTVYSKASRRKRFLVKWGIEELGSVVNLKWLVSVYGLMSRKILGFTSPSMRIEVGITSLP